VSALAGAFILPRSATFFSFFFFVYIRKSSSCGWIAESHMSESEQLFFIGLASAVTYIFTAPTCTITIITHELCALNAEFQHFITNCVH